MIVNMRIPQRSGLTLPLEWGLELSFSYPPCASGRRMAECLRLRLLCHFVALRTELHKGASFGIEAGDVTIDDRLPDDAEGGPGTKVVFLVELMHHLHDVVDRKAGVLDVRHLVAAAV